jgi:hypothetical protein
MKGEPMKILELKAENFKRLRAVEIKVDPASALVIVSGRNGAGKSSVLDAIEAALGGKDHGPAEPVRRGADGARVVVRTEKHVVTRHWSAEGKTYLTVESPEGLRYPSPQKMLDELVGPLSFDPLAFLRMPPKEQGDLLRRVAGLDLAPLDRDRALTFDQRAAVNRDVKQLEAELVAHPEVEAPDEEVSLTERVAALEGAQAEHRRQETLVRAVHDREAEVAQARAKVVALEHNLELARAEEARSLTAREKAEETYAACAPLPDREAALQAVRDVETVNILVRAKKARAATAARLEGAHAKAAELSGRIETLDEERRKQIAAAPLPVPGLGFTPEGEVTLGDLPLAQASQAEGLRLAVAVGAALNPTLRFLPVRDGSLLDAASLALLGELAAAAGAQVWLERVSEDGAGCTVLIEDGAVAEPRP